MSNSFPNFHIAVPTAFYDDLSLDIQTTLNHIGKLYDKGIRSLMLCGSTGEQHCLLQDEKSALLNSVADMPKDLTLIFGVSHPYYQKAVLLAEAVEKTGVSAILLAPPPYILPAQNEFLSYTDKILSVTSKPIILYNNPERTGFDMAVDTLVGLSRIPQVIGVKDPSNIIELKSKIDRDWLYFAGGEMDLAAKISQGFNGLSSMAGNVLPNETKAWFDELLGNPNAALSDENQMILDGLYQGVPLIQIKNALAEKLPNMKNHRRP